jgi:hypothetical protein
MKIDGFEEVERSGGLPDHPTCTHQISFCGDARSQESITVENQRLVEAMNEAAICIRN